MRRMDEKLRRNADAAKKTERRPLGRTPQRAEQVGWAQKHLPFSRFQEAQHDNNLGSPGENAFVKNLQKGEECVGSVNTGGNPEQLVEPSFLEKRRDVRNDRFVGVKARKGMDEIARLVGGEEPEQLVDRGFAYRVVIAQNPYPLRLAFANTAGKIPARAAIAFGGRVFNSLSRISLDDFPCRI